MNGIGMIFKFLAQAFDSIPFLNKFKGYRATIGLVLLGIAYGLDAAGINGGGWVDMVNLPLQAFIGLALNAKAHA